MPANVADVAPVAASYVPSPADPNRNPSASRVAGATTSWTFRLPLVQAWCETFQRRPLKSAATYVGAVRKTSEATDAGEVPTPFVAATTTLYDVSDVRPATVVDVTAPTVADVAATVPAPLRTVTE